MSEETVAQRVIRVIATNKKMAPEELSPATRFEDLKMDSLDALNMIFALEEEFDIDIPNEEAAKMKSVDEAIHGVEELLKAKSSASRPTDLSRFLSAFRIDGSSSTTKTRFCGFFIRRSLRPAA